MLPINSNRGFEESYVILWELELGVDHRSNLFTSCNEAVLDRLTRLALNFL